MKKAILSLTVLMLAVFMVGCTHNSPKNIAKAYMKAIQEQKYEEAVDCMYISGSDEDVKETKEEMVSLLKKFGKSVEQHQGIKKFEVTGVEENGDSATVKGIVTYNDGKTKEDTVKTVKVDGKWYIDADK